MWQCDNLESKNRPGNYQVKVMKIKHGFKYKIVITKKSMKHSDKRQVWRRVLWLSFFNIFLVLLLAYLFI